MRLGKRTNFPFPNGVHDTTAFFMYILHLFFGEYVLGGRNGEERGSFYEVKAKGGYHRRSFFFLGWHTWKADIDR